MNKTYLITPLKPFICVFIPEELKPRLLWDIFKNKVLNRNMFQKDSKCLKKKYY